MARWFDAARAWLDEPLMAVRLIRKGKNMGRWGWLKKVGKVAGKVGLAVGPTALTTVKVANPVAGILIRVAEKAIIEAQKTGATGDQKKAKVMDRIDELGPSIIDELRAAGMGISDPDRFKEGTYALVEALNHLLKSSTPIAEGDDEDFTLADGVIVAKRRRVDGAVDFKIDVPASSVGGLGPADFQFLISIKESKDASHDTSSDDQAVAS